MMQYLNPEYLLSTFGPLFFVIACLMIFSETGLLVGFFLPGDSLLFALGLFIGRGSIAIPLWLAMLLLSICAFAGDQTGYWIGRKLGPAVFNRPNSKLFKRENVDRAHEFFEHYGSRAVILAHFVPIMRTFIPVAAGIGNMSWRKYTTFNLIGILGWTCGVTLLGSWLGGFEIVRKNIEVALILFVVISFIPIGLEILRARKR